MSKEIFETITKEFIEALEQDQIPWKQTWASSPSNFSTDTEYRGINLWRLSMTANKNNWPNKWATFNQIKALDGSIKAGSTGTKVYFWKPLKVTDNKQASSGGEEKEKFIPMLKTFTVFNIAQATYLPAKYTDEAVIESTQAGLEAKDLIGSYCAREGLETLQSTRAAYSPTKDQILMPAERDFVSEAEYLSTYFHELTHSTGHKARLAREGITETHYYGDETYSKEELIAEMGASFLCAKTVTSTDFSLTNSKAYIQGWIKALKNDAKLLMQAASKAQKAVDFIINGKEEKGEV